MVKTNLVICAMLLALTVVILIPHAYASNVDIQVTDTGFGMTDVNVNSGDTITFINEHQEPYGIEPHCISDPYAQPYTIESCWIIDQSELTRTYTIQESQVFYDRFFTSFAPLYVNVSTGESNTTEYIVEDDGIDSAPVYTGSTNESQLQSDLSEITGSLTNALENIGELQNQLAQTQSDYEEKLIEIVQLQSEITVLENQVVDVTPYTNQIYLLTQERDQWKQTAENWYAVSLEQVRIMINVLGL